jgi:hypothetical protein
MRQNLDSLSVELYNAISNWNDFTENEDGENILTESEVGGYANALYELMTSDMMEIGQIQ